MIRTVLLLLTVLLALALCLSADTGVAGKWAFTLDTEGGARMADADFQVDGDKVTGKWGESTVKGTFADGKLDLAFPMESPEAGFSATMKITGKLDGADLVGTWEFGQYSGSYRAKRKSS